MLVTNIGCMGIRDCIIGKTDVDRTFDANNNLIQYRKANKKSKSLVRHPHNSFITRTRIQNYKDGKIIEKSFEKSITNMKFRDPKTLKYKKVVWDENRNKIKVNE